jgi:hypothetical protein
VGIVTSAGPVRCTADSAYDEIFQLDPTRTNSNTQDQVRVSPNIEEVSF